MSTQPMQFSCPRCSGGVAAGAAFCGRCGNRLGSAPGFQAHPVASAYPPGQDIAPSPPQWQSAPPGYPVRPAAPAPGWMVPGQQMYAVPYGKSKSTAVLLAVFLSFWTWLYTYRVDATKFWVGLTLALVSIPLDFIVVGWFVGIGVWVWALVDTCRKTETQYRTIP